MSRASNLAGFSTSIQSVAPSNLVVGVITATSFVGDGSGLTNAGSTLSAGSGAQRVVLTSLTSGTMTTAATDADLAWNSTTNTLSATNVSIAGTLTYEDVTNVDSLGIITARTGIVVTAGGINATGVITATSFSGSGANLTGVSAGLEIKQAGTSVGTAITQVNFASGATLTTASAGISTITITAPNISTTSSSPSANTVVTLNLSTAQHHELTLTAGITTITCSGGNFGESHSVVIIQPSSGIATVGFSTFFLFPSGSSPVMSQGSSKFDLVSFVVKRVGAGGTQLLASAGLDYQ